MTRARLAAWCREVLGLVVCLFVVFFGLNWFGGLWLLAVQGLAVVAAGLALALLVLDRQSQDPDA